MELGSAELFESTNGAIHRAASDRKQSRKLYLDTMRNVCNTNNGLDHVAINFFKYTEYQDNCAITVAKAYGSYRRSGGAFWMNSSDISIANRLVNQNSNPPECPNTTMFVPVLQRCVYHSDYLG